MFLKCRASHITALFTTLQLLPITFTIKNQVSKKALNAHMNEWSQRQWVAEGMVSNADKGVKENEVASVHWIIMGKFWPWKSCFTVRWWGAAGSGVRGEERWLFVRIDSPWEQKLSKLKRAWRVSYYFISVSLKEANVSLEHSMSMNACWRQHFCLTVRPPGAQSLL